MLKTTFILLLFLGLLGPVSACPLIDVGVGPDDSLVDNGAGLANSASEKYFLVVVVSMPEAPGSVDSQHEAEYDCAHSDRPSNAGDVAQRIMTQTEEALDEMLAEPEMSASGFVPACIAGPEACTGLLPCAYASYNTTSGRYFVNATDPADPWGGASGIEVLFDCDKCPPPACCP